MGITIRFEFHLHISRTEGSRKAAHENQADSAQPNRGFLETATEVAERLRSTLSPSTIGNYKTALRSFREYCEGRDLPVSQLSRQTFKGYERWLLQKNVCLNTISCYMRSLRSLLQKLDNGLHADVFDSVYTGQSKTEKRAVSESDIASLKKLSLKPRTFACLARDLFLFSFYALGMPFVDMAFLRKSQISDNQIVYYRHKTGQRVAVHLEPCMIEIINRYQSAASDYVFPLLHSSESEMAYSEYLYKLSRYNRTLKTLARKAGIKSRLTSYTSRHSWASVAFSNNVDLPVISKALGHTNPQTTLIYIKEINDSRLEEANKSILDVIAQNIFQ